MAINKDKVGFQAQHILNETQQAILSCVPLGSILDQVLNAGPRLKAARVMSFCEKLQDVFSEKLNDCDLSYDFSSEHFVDLIECVFKEISITNSEKKLEALRAILVNDIKNNFSGDQAELFCKITSSLHENEIVILKRFKANLSREIAITEELSKLINEINDLKEQHRHLKVRIEKGIHGTNGSILRIEKQIEQKQTECWTLERDFNKLQDFALTLDGISSGQNILHINNLVNSGLIIEKQINIFLNGRRHSKYIVTDFGNQFIEFISLD